MSLTYVALGTFLACTMNDSTASRTAPIAKPTLATALPASFVLKHRRRRTPWRTGTPLGGRGALKHGSWFGANLCLFVHLGEKAGFLRLDVMDGGRLRGCLQDALVCFP